MTDFEEENMLSFPTGIGEISVGGFNNNAYSKITTNLCNQKSRQHDLRSAYRDEECSPPSFRDKTRPRYQQRKYSKSQRSGIIGRVRSPISMCSAETTRSVNDVTDAIKLEPFKAHELKMIKEVVSRRLKTVLRKEYEEKRHQSMLLKNRPANFLRSTRNVEYSDRDSDSPVSSDEDGLGSVQNGTFQCRSNINQVDKPVYDNHQYANHINPLKKNIYSINQKINKTLEKPIAPPDTYNGGQTLKDLFNKEYVYASQRYNNTTEKNSNKPKVVVTHASVSSENETCSEGENRKRPCDYPSSDTKRIKLSSPPQSSYLQDIFKKPVLPKPSYLEDIFKKPVMSQPTKRSAAANEVLISKSAPPAALTNNVVEEPKDTQNETENSKLTELSTKSFSKRKLFTQKADIVSSKEPLDAAEPSPQVKVNKERHKARKLVSSQSCLNRDVSDEEENLLDLVYSIVPHKNIKEASNKMITNNDKWCESDISDTFTDETLNGTVLDNAPKNKVNNGMAAASSSKCRDVRIPHYIGTKSETFKYVGDFFGTDIESEMESENIPVWKISRPTDKIDITEASICSITNQVAKNRANILTVPDLNNKIVNSKKRATEIVSQDKETDENVAPNVSDISRNQPERSVKMREEAKRPNQGKKSINSSCSGSDVTRNSRVQNKKERGRTSKSQGKTISLDTSIASRTRSKHRNESSEISKGNISQISNCNTSIAAKKIKTKKK